MRDVAKGNRIVVVLSIVDVRLDMDVLSTTLVPAWDVCDDLYQAARVGDLDTAELGLADGAFGFFVRVDARTVGGPEVDCETG